MERTTIDFGIDLGTTNSKIAVFNGSGATVFKNNLGQEYTPSAVWIDKKGNIKVGRKAKEMVEYDDNNSFSEFKRQMGEPKSYRFAASGRQMKPEELSAEVLKELRKDVQQSTGEEVKAAVISVPAAFDLPQCDATNKAARLAGLSFSPLVQEPVAAALAYGFQSKSDRVFWMVYDFGGGTFDVAIIQVRDGQIRVVTHSGDNYLGGKNIDWEIVDRLLVPSLTKGFSLTDFNRGNSKWKSAFAKLKLHAEQAKIELSRDNNTNILIENLCNDERGKQIQFEHELKRNEIEPLIEPFVEQSINHCKTVLEEKKLSPDNIERLILVGGPTLTPIFRDILKEKLKINLDISQDPLTVNAKGAAIFARTQPIPKAFVIQRPAITGEYRIDLKYETVGSDIDPDVGGIVTSNDGKSVNGFTIEFKQEKTLWRSGKIVLSSDGKFMTTIHAEDINNEFLIELCDLTGNLLKIDPDRFTYTHGMTISSPPLLHSVGVALANGEAQPFLIKGTPLPHRHREIHRTTVFLRKGESGTLLRIPVVEGENTRRADRNTRIGEIVVTGDQIRRDIPVGSEVEITIDMDESRLVRVKAYIPIIDEVFDKVITLEKVTADPQKLAEDFKREKIRLQKIRDDAHQTGTGEADQSIQKIQDEGMEHDIQASLAASSVDPDAAARCQKRIIDLKVTLDKAEDALQWTVLVTEAKQEIETTRDITDQYGKEEDKKIFQSLADEIAAAIKSSDIDLLHQKMEYLDSFRLKILIEQPGWWVGYFEFLEQRKLHMRDQLQADNLLSQGRSSIDNNDFDGLKSVVRQLIGLLSIEEQQEAQGYGGTTMPKEYK
jgi:molecular chaperone DnaK